MEIEISEFMHNVGGLSLREGNKYAEEFRKFFKRSNYFLLSGTEKFVVVKISRSKKPFWGLGKEYVDFLNQLDYCLVLLVSSSEGWVFSKNEVISYINRNDWPLAGDGDYKIHHPLQQSNKFYSSQEFKVIVGLVAP